MRPQIGPMGPIGHSPLNNSLNVMLTGPISSKHPLQALDRQEDGSRGVLPLGDLGGEMDGLLVGAGVAVGAKMLPDGAVAGHLDGVMILLLDLAGMNNRAGQNNRAGSQ